MRQRPEVGSYEEIVAAATRATGLDDFDGTSHEEGLRILVEDLNSAAAGLTPQGNYAQRSDVKSALVARLLSQNGFTQNPEHADVAIERPLFVMGLPRTGTTALHRLLTADPGHQGMEVWLSEVPQPRPPREEWSKNPIFNAIDSAYAQHREENPEFSGIHYSTASTVEECWRLLRQAGKSLSYESLALVPRYTEWLEAQDWVDAYRRHKQNLQLIGLNDADKRWVLKNPSHLRSLDSLMEVYPDALIVTTHRPPATCIASACSLSAAATEGTSTTFVGDTIGRTQLHQWSVSYHAFHDARASYDSAQFVDIDYADFVGDPVGTARGIYEAFGLSWTEEVAAAVQADFDDSQQGERKSSHRYDLGEYGLTEQMVADAFAR